MQMDVGSYRIHLPASAVLLGQRASKLASSPIVAARIGPFELTAHVVGGSLNEWREYIDWTTKGQTRLEETVVNSVPGLKIAANARSVRRLDYAFQSPGFECIEIVATSETDTTQLERAVVYDALGTIHVR